jgi:pimeloyl-ACP methyl ester carboxylesterase
MPLDKINGANLYWERTGFQGEALVLVHGSWGDHHNWDTVTNELSQWFRILTYDRRGHSQSERLNEQGSMEQDVADMIALIEFTEFAPAHIIGNSGGAAIVLKAAASHPEYFLKLVAHEPPLFGLLSNIPEAQSMLQEANGRIQTVIRLIEQDLNEEAAKQFVETIAFAPGAWLALPQVIQQSYVYNASTFLDETKDPDGLQMDLPRLAKFTKPALLTKGTKSPPFFAMVVEQLTKVMPNAHKKTFEGAAHVPHLSHPKQYVQVVSEFCLTNANRI